VLFSSESTPGPCYDPLAHTTLTTTQEVSVYRKILVPLDGSGHAEAILRQVEETARRDGAQVILLRVIEPHGALIDPHESSLALMLNDADRQQIEASQYLHARAGELRAMGINVATRLARGSVVRSILDTADAEAVDLIAMSSRGRSGLGQMLYGSVAMGVLHGAHRPLLLIRAADVRANLTV
jgi:nucleotide-binding universal stress UspA family protein